MNTNTVPMSEVLKKAQSGMGFTLLSTLNYGGKSPQYRIKEGTEMTFRKVSEEGVVLEVPTENVVSFRMRVKGDVMTIIIPHSDVDKILWDSHTTTFRERAMELLAA